MQLLKNEDFECVAVIAIHCDQSKLCAAENEAITFDLESLFCGNWEEVKDIIDEVLTYESELASCNLNPDCLEPPAMPVDYDKKYKLVYGGSYLSQCGNKTLSVKGVLTILTYYTYARYTIINSFNDTPNGSVTKSNSFSIPKSGKELEVFSDKYRNMGYSLFLKLKDYICSISEVLYISGCSRVCSCGHKNCNPTPKTSNKGYGFRSKIISK